MKIWLIKDGETLPIDGKNPRLFRMGLLAEALSNRGHDVVWWTSTHDHYKKTFRTNKDTIVHIKPNYQINMLHGCGYRKHISLKRFFHYIQIAKKFYRYAKNETKPNLILCALPTPNFVNYAVKYGNKAKVPVVIDIRDPWPDIYFTILPKFLYRFRAIFFYPLIKSTKTSLSRSTAIIAVSKTYLKWGLNYANRIKSTKDRVFYLGYKKQDVDDRLMTEYKKKYDTLVKRQHFKTIFIGHFCQSIALTPVIHAAKRLPHIDFIFCGNGKDMNKYQSLSAGLNNVFFTGWIDTNELNFLMQESQLALAPYSKQAIQSLPNKPFEYFSQALPIITSLQGELAEILRKYQMGLSYSGDDSISLTKIIQHYHDNRKQLKQLSNNAKRFFEQQCRAEIIYHQMCDYLES